MTTTAKLDAAVLAYRAEPTSANRDALLSAQRAHTDAFNAEQAREFVSRGRGFGVARRVPSYGAPYPIEHPED